MKSHNKYFVCSVAFVFFFLWQQLEQYMIYLFQKRIKKNEMNKTENDNKINNNGRYHIQNL